MQSPELLTIDILKHEVQANENFLEISWNQIGICYYKSMDTEDDMEVKITFSKVPETELKKKSILTTKVQMKWTDLHQKNDLKEISLKTSKSSSDIDHS